MKEPEEMRSIDSLELFADAFSRVTYNLDTINPCPFCGRDAELVWEFDMEDGDLFFDIICANQACVASHGFVKKALDHDDAIKRWNRRVWHGVQL